MSLKALEHLNDNDNCPGTCATVDTERRQLRRKLRELSASLKEAKYQERRRHEEVRTLYAIFRVYNNDIYPSDIGQDWSWKVEDGVVKVTIEGKEFQEPVKYPER